MKYGDLPSNWIELFSKSYKKAESSNLFKYPSALRLSTASKSGLPSVRIALLKHYDKRGFVIYTNMDSRKGQDLKENPYASLYFYWPEIKQEIIVDGKVEMINSAESDDYFDSRPFFSKIGAHASKQSSVMSYKIIFITRIIFYTVKFFLKKKVNRPNHWKGFRVIPQRIEFVPSG